MSSFNNWKDSKNNFGTSLMKRSNLLTIHHSTVTKLSAGVLRVLS
jgi:hypothetical protein